MNNTEIRKLLKKFSNNTLDDKEIVILTKEFDLNPYYIKNANSWDITKCILRKIYDRLYPDYTSLPENWLDQLKWNE